MPDREQARHRMVDAQISRRGVRDERVLAALRTVPREAFVDEGFEASAYEDSALPIGSGQTISQPYIVARMAEAAAIGEADRVLEIGTGSGYAAAVLGRLAREVFTIERHAALAARAESRLRAGRKKRRSTPFWSRRAGLPCRRRCRNSWRPAGG
jgi:protein-L-isoaspartate(D-aspartate) O-methyltransferase